MFRKQSRQQFHTPYRLGLYSYSVYSYCFRLPTVHYLELDQVNFCSPDKKAFDSNVDT